MNQDGQRAAERCISELKDRGCDFSLLFWLRNPEMLPGSAFGNDMIGFMEKDMKIEISQFDDGLFRGGFFQALRREFNKTGLNSVSPQNYVEACGEGGKESALNKWRQERWPRPHQTFCFQTRAVSNSVFFIFQCWQAKIDCRVKRGLNHVNRFFPEQDGVRMMLRLLKERVGPRRVAGRARPDPRSDGGSGAGLHAPVPPEGDRGPADLRALLGRRARLAAYHRLGSGDAVVRRAADAGAGAACGGAAMLVLMLVSMADRARRS